MAIKKIRLVNGNHTTTLNRVVFNGVNCDKVYARTSENAMFILVYDKNGGTMKSRIIAGNWKMNPETLGEAKQLISNICNNLKSVNTDGIKVIVFPPSCFLMPVAQIIQEKGMTDKISVGAQNIYFVNAGAFTGEISAPQIKSIGCEYVLIGHSERRDYFAETSEMCSKKIQAALIEGLKVLYFVGETLEERESKVSQEVVRMQLASGLYNVTTDQMSNLIIVYEPVWAIGTGKTITPEQASDMCRVIREYIQEMYDGDISRNVTICYGGSVKGGNVKELMAKPDIDGVVVGGASLTTNFTDIVGEIISM